MSHATLKELQALYPEFGPNGFCCNMCCFNTNELHICEDIGPHRAEGTGKVLFCDVCYSTFAGNAYRFPDQYRQEYKMMQMTAYCTNMIIKEIRLASNRHPVEGA